MTTRIAVVGAGVAGVVAAHRLQDRHEVTLFEAAPRLGGHTCTIHVKRPTGNDMAGDDLAVDMGFIVCNARTYPRFFAFLDELGIPRAPTVMSFSYTDAATGFCYGGARPNMLFAQRRTLADPGHWRMLLDILRFNLAVERDLAGRQGWDGFGEQSLGRYLDSLGLGRRFRERYLLPMAGAIWSSPASAMADFPMAAFARFFHNHGLLALRDRPVWSHLPGGSDRYLSAFVQRFRGAIRLASPVRAVLRRRDGVALRLDDGEAAFDAVVLACHADEALAMLADADEKERQALGVWTYAANRAMLHTDVSFLPPQRRAWASWNYRHEQDAGTEAAPVSVHYHMNTLQRLPTATQHVVSLNPSRPIAPEHLLHETVFHHPRYSREAMASQPLLHALQGHRRTFTCGAYHGYGFHEDAVRAGERVASLLRVWRPA